MTQMIRLPNGYEFEHMTSGGAMGYNGLGWIHEQPLKAFGLLNPHYFLNETKTITLPPREGFYRPWKPWDTIRLIRKNGKVVGVVNSFGLRNPGLAWFIQNVASYIESRGVDLAVSIFSDSDDSPVELGKMAAALSRFHHIKAIGYNCSCPNTPSGIQSNPEKLAEGAVAIRKNCGFPIIAKLSPSHDIERIVPLLENEVEAFAINSARWGMVFPKTESPLAKYGGGGVSGKIAQLHTWDTAERIKRSTNVPVIVPSMWDYEDIAKMRERGFQAFSYSSVFIPFPWRPTMFAQKDQKR
jgi:dihydroorotate dehydrogenase